MLEWLSKKPQVAGSVAAFAAWDTFPWIFNRERCGFLINAGYEPLLELEGNPQIAFLNELKKDKFPFWQNAPYDPITFRTAVEYFRAKKPKIFFLSLNETDEWAHAGRYDEYLSAARRVDGYLRTLWEIVQADPESRDKTTLIFSTDHGRGEAPVEWKSHGAEYKGSENMWLMVMGPDTPPLGEQKNVSAIGQNQIAATLARFLSEDFKAAFPQAGAAIEEVFPKTLAK